MEAARAARNRILEGEETCTEERMKVDGGVQDGGSREETVMIKKKVKIRYTRDNSKEGPEARRWTISISVNSQI
jgi:hypothetical protein